MTKRLPVLSRDHGFQQEYMPVLLDAVKQFRSGLSTAFHSIYLNGSVARRDAVWGKSDVNFTIVVKHKLQSNEASALNAITWRLTNHYPHVRNVTAKVVILDDVLGLAGIFEWGVWLKHCSVCLNGDDLSSRFGHFEISWDIARTLNGDIKTQLSEYRHKIMKTKVTENYLDYCEHIGKKMIWSAYCLVLHRKQQWELDINKGADVFLELFPEHLMDIERAFILASRTQVPKKAAIFLMDQFGGWLVEEFDKTNRRIG
ncbi:nucleotidyltransferase domain-containing protein [Photobacterium sanguinicancri]|uniref:nucleotidyltransferase domain-containing protein n=1 Tax=Photobacterium sanguinicancri TaxID=875932 RepID=UPI0026E1758D|nr:nucleotidyltransferase domain-containing protein [Photobacterium sanguinicancri]MDO6496638.1 nucleotidyltransferase domain-containing protein [Photobacterium sanguinicancri]